MNVAETRTAHRPTSKPGRGGPIHITRAVWASSASTGAASTPGGSGLSKYSTWNDSAASRRRSIAGRPLSMRHPTSWRTSTPGMRSASAAARLRRRCGVTSELPPPTASCAALGPITATLDTAPTSSGSSPSLTSSTVPAAATWRATDRRPGSSSSDSAEGAGAPRIPTRSMSPSRWRTFSSTTASSTTPSRTAAARDGPSQADGPGISSSRPATAASRVEWVPNQSDMTSASEPHLPRSTRPIRSGCSPHQTPLTLL